MSALAAQVDSVPRSWTHLLLAAVRREFRAEVFVPAREDRVLARRAGRALPGFATSGLAKPLGLELQFVLQRRSDERAGALTPRIFDAVRDCAVAAGVESLLDREDRFWVGEVARLRAPLRPQTLALIRYARHQLQLLREEQSNIEVWEWDVWRLERIDPDGRWAHQSCRRIYFRGIEPRWLRALAKRWGRWRIAAGTRSPLSVANATAALRLLSRWLERTGQLPARPAELTRELLEGFLAHMRTSSGGETRRGMVIIDLKTLFDDVRIHGWEPELPQTTGYYRGEVPARPRPLPRFIDEFVMGQLETDAAFAALPDQTTRALVRLFMKTGLRSIDALRLPLDPITTDEAGAPYVVYRNHKLSRDAVVPISQRLLDELRTQQAELRERYPAPPPVLFPRPQANPNGIYPLELTTLNRRLRNWLKHLDVRDAQARPVRITSHQFRHTLGTRLVNNKVPLETIRRLLDHNSPEMTATYAQLKDETLRQEWERYQERINIRGEVIPLDPAGPLSDAAWAKENLARAKQTLPNGYCGLPLQQSCPHPNACLTCDHFLTTTEFLPQHRDQLERTEQLIADAQADGRHRVAEMNEPVRLNLVRIIDGLEALEPPASDAA